MPNPEPESLPADLERDVEALFRRLADAGHIPDRGDREIHIRLDNDGHLRWFTPSRIRVPASELRGPLSA